LENRAQNGNNERGNSIIHAEGVSTLSFKKKLVQRVGFCWMKEWILVFR